MADSAQVTYEKGKLYDGELRYQASKLAGCRTIPAVFTDGAPAEIFLNLRTETRRMPS